MSRRITAVEMVTLDGVMQGPVLPDEDTRDGFTHGGWSRPFDDEVAAQALNHGGPDANALLFGRRTYESFAAYWPKQSDDPSSAWLDAVQKYVVSENLTEPLPWQHSTLLTGDPATSVTALKATAGPDLLVYGSGELVRGLMAHHLIDALILLIHPITLGTGRRLFPEAGMPATFALVESLPTTTGVIVATYAARPPA